VDSSELALPEPAIFKNFQGVTVAVCLHAFYLDVLQLMLPYLKKIPVPFDLFLTCSIELREEVEAIIQTSGLSAKILCVENVGMDVLPFVRGVKEHNLQRYTCILKLHTKNNFSEASRAQIDMFLNLLLGSNELVCDILTAFRHRDGLTMVGPHDLYRSAHYMAYNNRSALLELSKSLERPIDHIDWGFFAGTMFWIRGSTLEPLVKHYEELVLATLHQASGKEVTGRDGSIAHALERLWGALSPSKFREIGLTYRRDAELTHFALRVEKDDVLLQEPIRRLGAGDVLGRWARAHIDTNAIKQKEGFDSYHYRANNPECDLLGIDPYLHFVLYGDLFLTDPSPSFSTAYYQLRRPDVVRKNFNTLAHYSTHGQFEGYSGTPTFKDWLELAITYRLLDEEWYRAEHGSLELSGLSLADHYYFLGRHLRAATSSNFDPKLIPAISSERNDDPLHTYLREHYIEESRAYDELTRILQNNDFALAPLLIAEIFRRFGVTAAPLSALALCFIRSGDWREASSLFDRYWRELISRELPIRQRRSVLPSSRIGNDVFDDAAYSKSSQSSISICVYTALYGDIDVLPPILSVSKYCRFVCFTDTLGDVDGWEYRIVEPTLGDPNLDAKLFKVLLTDFLEEFDYTLFIDANTLLMGRLDEFIESYLLGNSFVMFAHPERSDVYTEAVAVIESERHSPPRLLDQLRAYSDAGLPHDSGLIEASFIWRVSRDDRVRDLMLNWWQHILDYSKRDQLSLGFLMWDKGFRPKVIPNEVGSPRENKYFMKLPHMRLPRDVSSRGERRRVTSWVAEAEVWFLYGSHFVNSGSSVLRGDQLSQILRSAVPGHRGIFYTSFDNIENKIVVLTKGYMAQMGVEGVQKLKERGNVVLADFVDAKPNEDMIPFIDVLVASSLRAFVDYRRRYPNIRSHHVTHHVDLRIASHPLPATFSAGYFGELVNTIVDKEISPLVDFVSVDTSTSRPEWMNQLGDYSFHYAIRRERGIDHFKPFLKGFVAAHCGANVLIQANAGDARFYLGESYPYLLPAKATEQEIVEALRRAKETFNGPEWQKGLDVMSEVRNRSSRDYVARELTVLLKTL
jgi:hypothetical protein